MVELTVRLTRASKGGQWVSGRRSPLMTFPGDSTAMHGLVKKLSKYHYVWGSGYATLNDLSEVLSSAYSKYRAVQHQHKAISTIHEAPPPPHQPEETIHPPADLIFLDSAELQDNLSEAESTSKSTLSSDQIA